MDLTREVKLLYKGAEGEIPSGVAMVVGQPDLIHYPFKRAMTQFMTNDFCEVEKAQLKTVTSIVASSQIAAWVAFYKHFPDRKANCASTPKESVLEQYKKVAKFGLVIKTFGKQARGEPADSVLYFTDPLDKDISSLGYTGAATDFKKLKMAPDCTVVRINPGEPILYVRIPYASNKYAILMGTSLKAKFFVTGTAITIELIDYAGPEGSIRIEGDSPIPGLSLRIVRPWTDDQSLTIRRSIDSCYYKDDSSDDESEDNEVQIVKQTPPVATSSKRAREDADMEELPLKMARVDTGPKSPESSDEDEL